eukprot:TRINITY_DN56_c0_g1_i1.p1 TRINITY_DN56_c0_g1~~TRINITY_DN56_c0_g1_i1.p1  ORF type:complete len:853 (+),score=155.87 TRINITY_DN56_c0_g1_i1:34-2559(+)
MEEIKFSFKTSYWPREMVRKVVAAIILVFLLQLASTADVTYRSVRVQALSPTLIRVENVGPKGFEDRTTFVVQDRSFPGIPIVSSNSSGNDLFVKTQYYTVYVSQTTAPTDVCFAQQSVDVDNPTRSPNYPQGSSASSAGDCCKACQSDPFCNGWVYEPGANGQINCWPLNAWSSTKPTPGRLFGCLDGGCYTVIQKIIVTDPSGKVLYSQQGVGENQNLLQWPSPLSAPSYSILDFPRFFVPAWGPSPNWSPSFPDTNGYDFTNNQNGDFYIFLLGSNLQSYFNSRSEFVKLVGPTPLLPDFAYGTWFTYWYSYTEAEAKDDIAHWKSGNLPLDVYGLDMNWRNTSNDQDHYYSHPNTALFPNFTEWFSFLHANGLKTYFNDHPFPVDWQTSPSEVGFRFGGLSEWMERGLDYWWFDHNWGFSIPPPNVLPVNGWTVSNTNGNWLGLDNAAWGSHVYFESVTQFYKNKGSSFRPITLTKFALPDWRPNMPSIGHQENPAHHRYPVWWTGDGVNLQASVQSMVDCGVHDFKPFVHSDCGGDSRESGGDLLRWTAHCTFGTIFRYHGSDHRPWTYTPEIESTIRSYLNMRYKLIPAFISAGQAATYSGFPIVARGDLFWPDQTAASDNNQYIHLNNTLVAPIWDSTNNITSRSVWVPPGQWQDAWDGSVVTGPKTINVSKPYEQIPMWHKRGSFMMTVDSPALRVEDQDWSVLTLETFPDFTSSVFEQQSLYSLGSASRTDLSMETESDNGVGIVTFRISEAEDQASRGWFVRLHLLPGQKCVSALVDGAEVSVEHIAPVSADATFFPWGGAGTAPAHLAGHIAEVQAPLAKNSRLLQFKIK